MTSPRFAQWRPHPWHGLSAGPEPPRRVSAFIEITPLDPVKYEIDKESGYLQVDRPQVTSSLPPALYGFIPRTYCGDQVAALMPGARTGDRDPLDICVFSERPIHRADIVLEAHVIGGLPMLDGGEADDKIIAVLANDPVWGDITELVAFPGRLIERLRHYFLSYKGIENDVEIGAAYSRTHAEHVITTAMSDYEHLRASE